MWLTLWFSTVIASASTNDEWFTRSWQTDEGLPNNYVQAIAQGDDGYLWVGTPAGLLRFDGIRFTPFALPGTENSNNNDPGIRALLPRRDGGLWVLTARGPLIGLNAQLSTVPIPTNGPAEDVPLGLTEDSQGGLWIAYPNVLEEVRADHVTEIPPIAVGPANASACVIVRDSTDHIWMARAGKVGVLQNGRFQQFAIPTPSRIIHLAPGRSHGVWVATGTHLYRCDADGSVQDYGSFQTGNPRAESWALMEDHAGAVWIGTDGSGLFRRDESGFNQIEIAHPFVLSLAEDREGNIWVGTAGGGLTRISSRGIQLEGYESGSTTTAIQSICEDTNGVLWGATQNGLLVVRENGKWERALTNVTTLGRVTCVAADRRGAVWIGTRDRRFYRALNDELATWTSREGLSQHSIVGWLPASNGNLWISEMGNPNIIQCLSADGKLQNFALPEGIGRIAALAEDSAGQVWAASVAGLLLRAGQNEFTDVSSMISPSAGSILCLATTPDGALWIGFDGGGLGRLIDGRFSRIDSRHGLFDDHISEIVTDDRGWFWFGSARGIFKVQGKDLISALDGQAAVVHSIHYGRNEGLFSMEANSVTAPPYISSTAFRSRDGSLWMPLRTAIAVVNPKVLREDPGPPPVLLTRVAVDNRVIADYGKSAAAVANLKAQRAPMQIGPGLRKLDFDFTALNLTAPESVTFRCQLEGWDDDWFTPETRTATYTHLAAGTYHFRVQASNGDGSWSEAKIPFDIAVAPFFWQTWWFRAAMFVLFTLAIVAAVRYVSFRRLRLKLRMVEQQASLDKERARIARDLHDDLGCRLTQVALTLNMADREIQEPSGTASRQLQRCADMVRQVAGSVDEIVWAVNPRNDALRYVIDYISQFAVEFLHAADITCRLDLPDQIPDVAVSPEVRHNLFLVAKEALNNITRHAAAGEVRININATPREITIAIEDNGRGFECAPDNASADGLRNMRQRMEEIGGTFQIDSKPGAGTRVHLRCSLTTQMHSQ